MANVKNARLVRRNDMFSTNASDANPLMAEEKADMTVGMIVRLMLLCVATVASGVANNVTFVLMGNAMPLYAAFLLYFTSAIYTIIYFIMLGYRYYSKSQLGDADKARMYKPGKGRSVAWYYFLTVVFVTMNGAFSQFADPHVNGALQSLINQMTLPLTAIGARLFLGSRFTNLEVTGACIVMVGSVVPILPPLFENRAKQSSSGTEMDTPFWVIMFLMSDLPSAVTNVLQEKLLSPIGGIEADEIHMLSHTNLWTVPAYMLCALLAMLPKFGTSLSLSQVWSQQTDAFLCFAGKTPLPPGCQPHAWFPVIAFCLSFVLYFYLVAIVTAKESAAFQCIVNTLVVPVSAITFSFKAIVGAQAHQSLDQAMIVGIVLIPVGILIYKGDDLLGQKKAIVPLIARH